MSATLAKSGATVQFGIGDAASPETFPVCAEVLSVSHSGTKLDVIDVSSMDSPSQTREKIGGLIDSGDVTFDLNFTTNTAATGIARLRTVMAARTTGNFKITYPGSAGVDAFAALVVQMDKDLPLDKQIVWKCKLAISGVITHT